MSIEENKTLIRRYYDELNRKSFAAYDEVVALDVTYNGAAVGRKACASSARCCVPPSPIST